MSPKTKKAKNVAIPHLIALEGSIGANLCL